MRDSFLSSKIRFKREKNHNILFYKITLLDSPFLQIKNPTVREEKIFFTIFSISPHMYIAFEGIVGSGKTTQVQRLVSYLEAYFPNKKVLLVREP